MLPLYSCFESANEVTLLCNISIPHYFIITSVGENYTRYLRTHLLYFDPQRHHVENILDVTCGKVFSFMGRFAWSCTVYRVDEFGVGSPVETDKTRIWRRR